MKFESFNLIVKFGVLTIIIFSYSITNFAQDNEIQIDTDLVTVPVTVIDREGRYVTDLKKESFQIFEDGKQQEVTFFEPVNELLTVFLLVDESGSMYEHLYELAIATNTFLQKLRPDDQIIIALFDVNVDYKVKQDYVKNVLGNEKINLKMKKDIPPITMVYDAMEEALKKIKKVSGRKAIVLFSDGIGSGYFSSVKSNLKDAEENEALIYTVQFNTHPRTPPKNVNKKEYLKKLKKADNYMQGLARITGGQHFQFDDMSKLEASFESIANELSQQYYLSYYPENPGEKGERREIKVKVNVPNVAVRARQSYIVGKSKD